MISDSVKKALRAAGIRTSAELTIRKNTEVRFEAPIVVLGALKITRKARIGACTYFRSGIIESVRSIGRYCSFGPDINIGELNHPVTWLSTSSFQYNRKRFTWFKPFAGFQLTPKTKEEIREINKRPPTIGNDVWVGAKAQILRGVTVGDGAIIGGGAFVNRDVAPYEIVGGIPAKHIKFRFPEDIRAELLELKWWQYDPMDLSGVNFRDVRAAIAEIRRRRDAGEIKPRKPKWRTYLDGVVT
ncbi:MAG: hypothetical protein NVV63_05970 [Opitutus sp.]|nr:hypothetical protein [Opitutus sp.]